MKKNKLVFLDTETTHNDDTAEIVAVAYRTSESGYPTSSFFKPTKNPISVEAMSVTHITNKMVEQAEPFEGSLTQRALKNLFHDEEAILVAHNAEFDVRMLNKGGVFPKQVICTMKCVRHLDVNDELQSYKMQIIRYSWDIEVEATAHDAAGDIIVLEEIYKRIAEKLTVEEMLKITAEPFLLRKLTFGKYKGENFSSIPRDYIIWLRRQDNITGDLAYTLDYYLNRGFANSEHE